MPTFGYETLGDYVQSIDDIIAGAVYTITEDGTADSITAGLYRYASPVGADFKCAIYLHSDSSLVGSTVERYIELPYKVKTWETFNFVTKPNLVANTEYVLVVWSNYPYRYILRDPGAVNQGHTQSITYNSWPDPASFTHDNYKYSIYCTYTPVAPPAPGVKAMSGGLYLVFPS